MSKRTKAHRCYRPTLEALESRWVPSGNPPLAVADSFSVLHDRQLTDYPLANDSDPENDELIPAIVNDADHGYAIFDVDGSFTYVPDMGYVGTDQVSYLVNDGTSDSNEATITISITNQAPTANNAGMYSVHHGGSLLDIGLLGNASDPDEDALTAEIVQYPSHGYFTFDSGGGTFSYYSDSDYAGSDSFTFQVYDGAAYSNVATVSLNVTNAIPIGNPDVWVSNGSSNFTVAAPGVLGNDADPDSDPLVAVLVSGPSFGTVTLNDDGSFSYDVPVGPQSADSFVYRAFDGVDYSDPVTVTLDIPGGTNGRPSVNSVSLSDDAPRTNDLLTAAVSGSDPEGDAINYTYEWQVNGIVVRTTTTTQAADFLDLSQTGQGDKTDTITVTVTPADAGGDGAPVTSAPAVVANSAPQIENPGDLTFLVGETVELQIVASDADGDMLFFSAEDLPLGLALDPYTGVLSGTVQDSGAPEGNDVYPARIRVTDGAEDAEVNPFFQVANITITSVTITPPAGFGGTLRADGLATIFTLTVTATGRRGANSGGLYWSVRETDGGIADPDDHLIKDRRFEIVIGQNGTTTFTIPFALFSKRDGVVRGVDEHSGEVNPGPIYARIATFGGTELRRSAGVTVQGAANAPSHDTAGANNITTITAIMNPPAGFTGSLNSHLVIPQVWSFTVTINGTANTTVSHLRWSVVEPTTNLGTEMVYEREFSVNIGASGVGTATIQFLLWANNDRQITGVDANSEQTTTGPIYALIEKSNGDDLAQSNTYIVRGT